MQAGRSMEQCKMRMGEDSTIGRASLKKIRTSTGRKFGSFAVDLKAFHVILDSLFAHWE